MASTGAPQGAAPPPFALPPADAELARRIDTLAAYAARNGLSFVQMMSERQGGNPDFGFLQGGPGHEYYAWALHCGLHGLPVGKPPAAAAAVARTPAAPAPAAQPQPQQDTSAALQGLPAEVSGGWSQVLGMLTGARDSIRNSQQWFMACAPYATGMAEMMLQHALSSQDYQKQLHVVYLANDILFKALSARAAGAGAETDAIAQAFRPRLGRMLRAACVAGGQAADVLQNLQRVVNFWAERGVYDRPTVDQLLAELAGAPQPAAAPAPPAAAAVAAPPQPAGGWDVAAAARAAAAALAARVNAPQAAPPPGHPPQQWGPAPGGGQQQWGQPPGAAPPPQQQYAGQPPQYPGQPSHPAGGFSGPPAPESYYPPGSLPQQPPYGQPPPPGAYPPGGFVAFPGQAQGFAPHAHHPGHHPPHGHHAGQPGPLPGGFPPHQPPHHAQPPPPAPAPEPEPEGFDPCSFPPGLIPRLVEDKLKTDPPYSPLSPLDIEAAGVPPPPQVDAYLKARVDKFYAQLADYRPGMLYSDIEVDAPRSKHFSDRGGPPAPHGGPPLPGPGAELPHAGLGLGAGPGAVAPLDDGSYGGPGLGTGAGGTGLGYGSARREQWEQRQRDQQAGDPAAAAAAVGPGGEPAAGGASGVDVFSTYRHSRSAGYHQMIISNAAKRWVPKGG